MIHKLRIKLIFASMASLLAVLLVIMASVSVLYYRKMVSDADHTLALLAENDGFFPTPFPHAQKDAPGRPGRPLSPELPYETRYFFVRLDGQGTATAVNTGKIAAVDTASALEYARRAWDSGQAGGFLGDYRYLLSPAGEGALAIFLDCSRSLDSFRTLLLSSAGVSLAGALLVLLLLVFLSGRIVRPFLENDEKQKRFITDAGHELKTPLAVINADVDVLAMDLGENEWLQDIQSQTGRLADLTNDLILLSRMQEQAAGRQMQEVDLSALLLQASTPFQALARAQGKTLQLSAAAGLRLVGDGAALGKLVGILLDNAVKYAPEGGEVLCRLERQRGWARLSVYNACAPITREQVQHLFERFYRADPSRNSQTAGYGLGLSIAQEITNAHRGRISAATEDGASLLVTVLLPLGGGR